MRVLLLWSIVLVTIYSTAYGLRLTAVTSRIVVLTRKGRLQALCSLIEHLIEHLVQAVLSSSPSMASILGPRNMHGAEIGFQIWHPFLELCSRESKHDGTVHDQHPSHLSAHRFLFMPDVLLSNRLFFRWDVLNLTAPRILIPISTSHSRPSLVAQGYRPIRPRLTNSG